jgi:GT2 family glycosyltransferase
MTAAPPQTGIVVIGRNLGPRLALCLRSVLGEGRPVVYVDSASTDNGPSVARSMNCDVVELDRSQPLSASRGRNAGVEFLRAAHPALALVQFVDGDCEIDPAWLSTAERTFAERPDASVLCGVVREKHRERSVYARLLDVDWGGPAGEVRSCGGIFMVRVDAFLGAGGFSHGMPAGEEAELCSRLRAAGGKVIRLATPMCTHDADMHTFGPWWNRAVRVGHTFAKSARLKGPSADPSMPGRVRSTMLWGLVLPLAALAGAIGSVVFLPLVLVPLGVVGLYGLQAWRIRGQRLRAGASKREASAYGVFTLVAKFAQALGCLSFWVRG